MLEKSAKLREFAFNIMIGGALWVTKYLRENY